MSKSIYLNDSMLKRIENIKTHISKLNYEPTEMGIINSALIVYEKVISTNNAAIFDENMIKSMIDARVEELIKKEG